MQVSVVWRDRTSNLTSLSDKKHNYYITEAQIVVKHNGKRVDVIINESVVLLFNFNKLREKKAKTIQGKTVQPEEIAVFID